MKFEDLNIDIKLIESLEEIGFKEMFPIQEKAIPLATNGIDIIGQAQTGTGKTAAFVIPIVERINPGMRKPQAIIIVPTRELAAQVNEEVKKIGSYKRIKSLAVYGGASIEKQIEILRRGVEVVVGTPGRLLDLLERRVLVLSNIKILVLDEADRMLDMGFIEDVEIIISYTPKKRQTMLFSATMPEKVKKLAERHIGVYEFIKVSEDRLTAKEVTQEYVFVKFSKRKVLANILRKEVESAIVFCNTKRMVDNLKRELSWEGLHVEAMHGGYTQSRRNKVLNSFKEKRVKVLIATDVAARGLDIENVSHVINYDLPRDPRDYVHRIGRTGRAGKKGKAISLVGPRDEAKLKEIEWFLNIRIKRVEQRSGWPKSAYNMH